jgi:plastocyanin
MTTRLMTTHRLARLLLGFTIGALPLTACAANSGAEPTRSYTVRLRAEDSQQEYLFIAQDPVDDLRVGDEVTFDFDNTGALPHDVQVVDPDGDQIGVSEVAAASETVSVTVLFEEPGFYRLNCLVDDHLTEHGMQAIVEVLDA